MIQMSEKSTNIRISRRTRYVRILREFLVHWRGYENPTWIDEVDLNWGAILHQFLWNHANQNQIGVMQSTRWTEDASRANLSPWDVDIRRVEHDEDGLAAILGAGISPRERLDEVAETLVPEKDSRIKPPPVSFEMLSSDHTGQLLSFVGAAKRDGIGAAACIIWNLLSWEIVAATGHVLKKLPPSRLSIQQLQGVIGSTQSHLLRLLKDAEELQARFKFLRLVHVKRYFNTAADYISKLVIQDQTSLELAEKLMWALNTSFDFTRPDTSFCLVHGWDVQGTVEAMVGDFFRDVQLLDAQEWRTKVQCPVEYARSWAQDLQAKAKKRRAEDHNRKWKELTDRLKDDFEVGDSILEKGSDFRYRLRVEGTEYRFYPWVHGSRLKSPAKYPGLPSETVDIPEDDDFDAALLREDSWEPLYKFRKIRGRSDTRCALGHPDPHKPTRQGLVK
ncbi:LOW QUALITY PROTEIN: hypothetical protein PHMEG_0002388 [Phytophthora megakarya]|uniref:RNase H type-1 domain-containing protein n=1 Tax=Phytophthora megakarya TaxID=4795 RepID=A0A225WYB8_9STRA|nr:LOW QUALITY PROTEIN: hypothetical protein PHMEG_0002388 [Phytophthora megakarya]